MKRTRASIVAVTLALAAILLPLSAAHADDVVPSDPPVAPSADPPTTPIPRDAAPPVYSPPLVYPEPAPPPPGTAITDPPVPTPTPPVGDIPRTAIRPPDGIIYAPDGTRYYQSPCNPGDYCLPPIKLPVPVSYIDSTGKVIHGFVEGATAAAQHAWDVDRGISDGSSSVQLLGSTPVATVSSSTIHEHAANSPAPIVPQTVAWAAGDTSLQPSQPPSLASSW